MLLLRLAVRGYRDGMVTEQEADALSALALSSLAHALPRIAVPSPLANKL